MRVLVCTAPETHTRLRAVLEGSELHFVSRVDDALRALQGARFDLLIVGMLFDESRGLELIQRIRSEKTLNPPPIAGVRGGKNPVAISPQLFDLPMRAMGASDVIDLGAIPNNEVGNQNIRERLARCASP